MRKMILAAMAAALFVTPAMAQDFKSSAFAPLAIMAALNNWPGGGKPQPSGSDKATQKNFLLKFAGTDLSPYKGNLWGKGGDCGTVNTFLREQGFPDVQLVDYPNCVGAAGVFKGALKWANPGRQTVMQLPDGRRVQGAKFAHFEARQERGGNIIIRLQAANPQWALYVVPLEYMPKMAVLLGVSVDEIFQKRPLLQGYTHVEVPAARFHKQMDVSWLIGLRTGSDVVGQALQVVSFEFDHKGAKGEAAAAVGATRGLGPVENVLRVDGPYIAVFVKQGVPQAPMVALVGEDGFIAAQ